MEYTSLGNHPNKFLASTFTNHSEIIILYEACVWLRRMINHILKSCGVDCIQSPTIIYEDNVAYIVQMETGYFKNNTTKCIDPKIVLSS